MQLQPDLVCDVVMTCCVLHNFLRGNVTLPSDTCESEEAVEQDRPGHLPNIDYVMHDARVTGAKYNAAAKVVRDKLASYFIGAGQVPWQWKHGNVVVTDNSTMQQ